MVLFHSVGCSSMKLLFVVYLFSLWKIVRFSQNTKLKMHALNFFFFLICSYHPLYRWSILQQLFFCSYDYFQNLLRCFKTLLRRGILTNTILRNARRDWQCVVLREIDFLLKFCDIFLACFTCGVKLLRCRGYRSRRFVVCSSQKANIWKGCCLLCASCNFLICYSSSMPRLKLWLIVMRVIHFRSIRDQTTLFVKSLQYYTGLSLFPQLRIPI